MTCTPSFAQRSRSSVSSTSSNQPTFRCVRPHTLVWSVGRFASAVERASTAICALFSNASTAPRSMHRHFSLIGEDLTGLSLGPAEDALRHRRRLGARPRAEHLGADAV